MRTRPRLGRPFHQAHLDEGARAGRLVATLVGAVLLGIAIALHVFRLDVFPQFIATAAGAVALISLVAIVEGRRWGALGTCIGGLTGAALRTIGESGGSLGVASAVITAGLVLLAVESATHASRYRSVAPPSIDTSLRRFGSTLQAAALGIATALGVMLVTRFFDGFRLQAGLVVGLLGLVGVLAMAWFAVGDIDTLDGDVLDPRLAHPLADQGL